MKLKHWLVILLVIALALPLAAVQAQGDDSDGDGVPDDWDACPDAAGIGENFGCPEGTAPPDQDGDTIPDLFDRCPTEAGPENMDCPDSDGDRMADIDDACPDIPGDSMLRGCQEVLQIALPTERAPLTTANADRLVEVGRLILTSGSIATAQGDRLAVLRPSYGPTGIDMFSLTDTAAPVGMFESRGGVMALSADGAVLINAYLMRDAGQTGIAIWDTPSYGTLHYMEMETTLPIIGVAVTPDGSIAAAAEGIASPYQPPQASYRLWVWNVASGQKIAALELATAINELALTPDGSQVLIGTEAGVQVWDVASQQQVAALNAVPALPGRSMALSPDGSRLAVGESRGMVSVWNLADTSQVYTTQVLTSTQWDVVASVAWSPDGSLLAVGGGPYVDGPPPEGAKLQFKVLDAASGEVLYTANDLMNIPFTLEFSADGTLLIVNLSWGVVFWGVAP